MDCYACSNEASRQCRRCSRLYCEVHGGDLCAECLNPTSALPSFNLYRGSLLALLVGTAIAIWLLVRPPGSADSPGVIIADLTPSPIVTEVVPTSTPDFALTAGIDQTPGPGATGTPAATPTAEDEPTETPEPEQQEYVVQDGDTLFGIAEQFAPPGVSVVDYADQIAALNGLGEDSIVNPGQVLILP